MGWAGFDEERQCHGMTYVAAIKSSKQFTCVFWVNKQGSVLGGEG